MSNINTVRPGCQSMGEERYYQHEENTNIIKCIGASKHNTGVLLFEIHTPNEKNAETLMWDIYHGEYDGG